MALLKNTSLLIRVILLPWRGAQSDNNAEADVSCRGAPPKEPSSQQETWLGEAPPKRSIAGKETSHSLGPGLDRQGLACPPAGHPQTLEKVTRSSP